MNIDDELPPLQKEMMRSMVKLEILEVLSVIDEQLDKALGFDDEMVEWEELRHPDDLFQMEIRLESSRLVVRTAAIYLFWAERRLAHLKGEPPPEPMHWGFLGTSQTLDEDEGDDQPGRYQGGDEDG